jgi:tetratricopeptide (TPR) repeat protein
MAMDLPTLRKLVALDANDPLSRFALGKKLFELNQDLEEAAEHLKFANERNPAHLASYHIRSQVLIKLGRTAEARPVLEEGIRRVGSIGEGMGRDLGPAMREMLDNLT